MNKEFLMWKRFLGIMAAALCVLNLTVGSAFSADLVKVPTAWLDEHETFLMWYAKEKGWDKEAGLELTMMPFDSGKSIVESLAAYDWAAAGCGAVHAFTTPMSDYLNSSPVANDETAHNAPYERKDSPILGAKGTKQG